ncbi:MAG: hypothetical protein IH961_07205, partial [Chloroflexi bacterium]|nr:hypothetical protein [Chloroflexota bacterium]
GALLADHAPDTATSTWSVISGDWAISSSDELEETSGTDLSDHRAIIDAGDADSIVQADITLGGGIVGLITRYADESNWMMAWFDDNRDEVAGTGDIVLAQLVAGSFSILRESLGINWTESTSTRTLSVTTNGEEISVLLDGSEIISATSSDLTANTGVGLFSRASSTNAFDDFLVSIVPLTADAGPDQTVASASGTVTLDGTGSASHSQEDQALTFLWTQTAGTSVSLSSATSSSPTFGAPSVGTAEELVFSLQVDDIEDSDTDTVTIVVTPLSDAPSGNTLVIDSFTDLTAALLENHVPDTAASTWSVIAGDWSITAGDKLEETSGTTSSDKRAVIDTGESDSVVQAAITVGGGSVGLITRYADESNWIMAWFDDDRDATPGTGDIVLAQLVGGTFTILGVLPDVAWTESTSTRTLSLIASGQDITVKLDGNQLISATSSDLTLNTKIGLFSKATAANTFDDLDVSLVDP